MASLKSTKRTSLFADVAVLDSSIPAIRAGVLAQPEMIVTGGKRSVGKIVFTGNLIAGDTVTINGVVFTCMASGAAGELQFNVGGSLSASLDALIVKLEACTNPLVSAATYTKTDTSTAVTMTVDKANTLGNSYTMASTHSTVVVTQPTGGKDVVYASLDVETTIFNMEAADLFVILEDGVEGQTHTFYNLNGTFSPAIYSTYFDGYNAMWLPVNEQKSYRFLGGKWRIMTETSGGDNGTEPISPI
jgi:hypothetical protein